MYKKDFFKSIMLSFLWAHEVNKLRDNLVVLNKLKFILRDQF